jgi:hypothetical protein
MATSIVVPTPPGAGQPVTLTVGKNSRTWANAAEALAWANDVTADRDLVYALAVRLAAGRPALRGKTLTFDPAAAANLVTVA